MFINEKKHSNLLHKTLINRLQINLLGKPLVPMLVQQRMKTLSLLNPDEKKKISV